MPKTIAVFYLNRYVNPGIHLKNFIKSICQNRSDSDYVPYVINKGFPNGALGEYFSDWKSTEGSPARNIYISDEGVDLSAYFKASAVCDENYCLFFNSYSEIMSNNWLDYYINAFEKLGNDAIVGATGSYEIYGSPRKFTGAQLPWNHAHVRTNAFMVPTDLFLSMRKYLPSKQEAFAFESGDESMSQQIARGGGRLAIVGRNGCFYEPQDWPRSRTFRYAEQENLLVSDNRTREYQISKFKTRQRLSQQTWGSDLGFAGEYKMTTNIKNWMIRKFLT